MVLAGGNLFKSIRTFAYGIPRMTLLMSGQIDEPLNIWWCMASLMPIFSQLGYVISASMQVLIGMERLFAITAFNWYRINWSPRKSWISVLVIYIISSTVRVTPIWYNAIIHNPTVTKECSVIAIIPPYKFPAAECVIVSGIIGMTLICASIISGFDWIKNSVQLTPMRLIWKSICDFRKWCR